METVVEAIGYNGKDSVVLAGEQTGKDGMWLATDVEGLMDPEVQTQTRSPANLPGTRYVSHRIIERTLIFKVTIANDSEPGGTWRERDTRWRRLWSYGDYSTIRVTTDQGARDLQVRLQEITVDTEFDPHVNSATDVTMTVVADDPFWYETPAVKEVTVAAGATSSITITETNPTGNPVFPIWVLEAPGQWAVSDWSAADPDKMLTLPSLGSGAHLVVDTDPAARQLRSATQDPVWARMNGVRFRNEIPPYTGKVTFKVKNVSGVARSAQLRIPRPFNRPWGA